MRQLLPLFFALLFLSSCTPKWEKMLKTQLVEAPSSQAEIDKNLIIQYAIENKLNLQSTDSGIYYLMEKEGTGEAKPDMKSIITAHYHGMLLDGKVFDSSVDRGEPFEFSLGRVVKGWQESIPMLKKGGKGKFFIPSGLAYGERGAGKDIKPNSVLIFDIELIDFISPEARLKATREKEQKEIMDYASANGLVTQKTKSGLHYVMLEEGTGEEKPTTASNITAHYHGMLLDGTVFDSSVERGQPFEFSLGRVIPGWQEGIALMKKGAKAKFIIPSHLAYGPRGAGKLIGPNSILVFEVELIDF